MFVLLIRLCQNLYFGTMHTSLDLVFIQMDKVELVLKHWIEVYFSSGGFSIGQAI
jgi:hypothetical protein